MNIEETKNNLLKILEQIGGDQRVKETFKKFIETYSGTNQIEFESAMALVFALIMKIEVQGVKAKAYDDIKEKNEDFNEGLNKMKSDFDKISKGVQPNEPFINSD